MLRAVRCLVPNPQTRRSCPSFRLLLSLNPSMRWVNQGELRLVGLQSAAPFRRNQPGKWAQSTLKSPYEQTGNPHIRQNCRLFPLWTSQSTMHKAPVCWKRKHSCSIQMGRNSSLLHKRRDQRVVHICVMGLMPPEISLCLQILLEH